MDYPPPPWTLVGSALQAVCTLSVARAARCVPPPLRVVPVVPGATLAGLWLARYGQGSTVCYHELVVMPALVRSGASIGAWVSHIYVDSATSLAGGRAIWGLPKQLAEFAWREDAVSAAVDGAQLLSVAPERLTGLRRLRRLPRLPLRLPAFGTLDGRLVRFEGRGASAISVGRAAWRTGPGGPLEELGLAGDHWTLHHRGLKLVVPAPPD